MDGSLDAAKGRLLMRCTRIAGSQAGVVFSSTGSYGSESLVFYSGLYDRILKDSTAGLYSSLSRILPCLPTVGAYDYVSRHSIRDTKSTEESQVKLTSLGIKPLS